MNYSRFIENVRMARAGHLELLHVNILSHYQPLSRPVWHRLLGNNTRVFINQATNSFLRMMFECTCGHIATKDAHTQGTEIFFVFSSGLFKGMWVNICPGFRSHLLCTMILQIFTSSATLTAWLSVTNLLLDLLSKVCHLRGKVGNWVE